LLVLFARFILIKI